MRFHTKMLLISVFSVFLFACSDNANEKTVSSTKLKKGDITMHPELKPRAGEEKSGLAEAIKKQTLPDYPTKTIGKAFGEYSYFSKKEWNESFAGRGKIYVDFIGWSKPSLFDPQDIKNGISAKGIAIKFVINPEAPFYIGMVSKVEVKTDGKTYTYPLPDVKAIIDSIYENKEIKL